MKLSSIGHLPCVSLYGFTVRKILVFLARIKMKHN